MNNDTVITIDGKMYVSLKLYIYALEDAKRLNDQLDMMQKKKTKRSPLIVQMNPLKKK